MENKGCKHKGKFNGVGQNVIATEKGLLVISSCVCGECGHTIVSLNTLNVELQRPRVSLPVNLPNLNKK
jgi:hypothetical protein